MPDWASKVVDKITGSKQEPIKPNANGEYMSTWEDRPQYMSPVNTNKLTQNTSNVNTNNQFTINTNQPTEIVAQNLMNTFMPTQVQYSTVTV